MVRYHNSKFSVQFDRMESRLKRLLPYTCHMWVLILTWLVSMFVGVVLAAELRWRIWGRGVRGGGTGGGGAGGAGGGGGTRRGIDPRQNTHWLTQPSQATGCFAKASNSSNILKKCPECIERRKLHLLQRKSIFSKNHPFFSKFMAWTRTEWSRQSSKITDHCNNQLISESMSWWKYK